MKIALLNPQWQYGEYVKGIRSGSRWPHTRKLFFNIYPFPFPLAYASSLLKKEGHEVLLKDCIAEDIHNERLLEILDNFRPDAIFFETMSPTYKYDKDLIDLIRQKTDTIIITGGQLSTSFPEKILQHADFAIAGECEMALKVMADNCFKKEACSKIPGVSFIKENKLHRTPPELITELDTLPWPDRDFGEIKKYQENFASVFPNASMLSSRGCPHKCSFCLESYVFNHKPNFRKRNVKDVVDEMEFLKIEYGIKEIYFDDTSFTVNRPRVHEICKEIIGRSLKIKWSCMADSKVDYETLKLMKESGCTGIKIGVESINEPTLKSINKPMNSNHAVACAENCQKLGIFIHGTFIIGLPDETPETIDETINFAFNNKFNWMQFSPAIPYPGTPFFNKAKENGWLINDSWDNEKISENVNLEYPGLSSDLIRNKLNKARKKLNKRVFSNFSLIKKYLKLAIYLKDKHSLKIILRRFISIFQ